MVRRHPLLGRQVAEHCGLLKVGASHASHPIADSSSLQEIPAFFRSLLGLEAGVLGFDTPGSEPELCPCAPAGPTPSSPAGKTTVSPFPRVDFGSSSQRS